ncbi:hypothetical protein EIN_251050 [Entamoeba invadens IP1]|uniref:Uncharacterized protein n=1 Tax=Entamoeba invadens IP1 TaxID=370355 RepID=A0A0A1UEE4_ENTIV|nr:hypothetical protein EIN_251050 [Entamoeba invadens IP1]ELP94961.1 hypothetical protein EIN_251050 [Entamoeba invadens IP1]|eukprot:XP_004261732.1 hypothetical protein EIN_251050 [Entamoeba invadens IP1]
MILVLFLSVLVVGQFPECRGTVCKKLFEEVKAKIAEYNQQYTALEEEGRAYMVQYDNEKSDLQLVRDAQARQKIREMTQQLMSKYKELPAKKNQILKEVVRALRPLTPALQGQLLRNTGLFYKFAPEYNSDVARYIKIFNNLQQINPQQAKEEQLEQQKEEQMAKQALHGKQNEEA